MSANPDTLEDALDLIEKLKGEIEGTCMLIAQADTGGVLRNSDSRRLRLVVEDAQAMTKRYGFFDYWR